MDSVLAMMDFVANDDVCNAMNGTAAAAESPRDRTGANAGGLTGALAVAGEVSFQ